MVAKNQRCAGKTKQGRRCKRSDKCKTHQPLEKECPICFEGMRDNYMVVLGRCQHTFHRACIVGWLDTGVYTCPMCRRGIDDNQLEDLNYVYYLRRKLEDTVTKPIEVFTQSLCLVFPRRYHEEGQLDLLLRALEVRLRLGLEGGAQAEEEDNDRYLIGRVGLPWNVVRNMDMVRDVYDYLYVHRGRMSLLRSWVDEV